MKPKEPPTPMPIFAPIVKVELDCGKEEVNVGCEGEVDEG